MLLVSIIIPARNEERWLRLPLTSLTHQTLPRRDFEIIVVDNGSSDRTAQIARDYGADLVIGEDELGTSAARDTGWRQAQAPLVAFLDADCEAPPDWLERIVNFFPGHPDVVSLSGPYHYREHAPKPQLARLERLFFRLLAKPYHHLIHWLGRGAVAMGGNFACRRRALEQIDGFDRQVRFFGDEAAVNRKLRRLGKLVFDLTFWVWSSNRRLEQKGILKVVPTYIGHQLKQTFWRRQK